jgi:hypothetical protein
MAETVSIAGGPGETDPEIEWLLVVLMVAGELELELRVWLPLAGPSPTVA